VTLRICIMCDAPYVGSLGLSAFRASSEVSLGVAYRVNLCAECVKAAHAVRAVGALGGPVALVEPDGHHGPDEQIHCVTGEPPTHARDTLPAPEDNGATS